MNKERLEEIKQYYSRMTALDECTQSDIRWLIEQAERVHELEELLTQIKYDKSLCDKTTQKYLELKQENKQLQEELEILSIVINSAENADELNAEYARQISLEGSE